MRRLLCPLLVCSLSLGLLLFVVDRRGTEQDEDTYLWSAAYYGGRIAHLDFSPGTDPLTDPGWSPTSYWALTQPMGTRALYAAAMGLSNSPASALPYSYYETPAGDVFHGPLTVTPRATVLLLRLVGIGAAVLGLGLLAWRLGWAMLPGWVWFMVGGHAIDVLPMAWAEGPLLLGFGVCAVAWGTRWFGAAAGLAAAFKLTALGLWPLLLWPRSVAGGRWWLRGPLTAVGVWLLTEPPAWFAGGPLYLVTMLLHRDMEWQRSSVSQGALLWADRYWLPLEVAAVVGSALVLRWAAVRVRHWRYSQSASGRTVSVLSRAPTL